MKLPQYLIAKKNIQKSGKNYEKKVAKRTGGKLQPGSGNQWYAKGDIKAKDCLIECKETDSKQYILHLKDLKKIFGEAIKADKIPIFSIKVRDYELFGYVRKI